MGTSGFSFYLLDNIEKKEAVVEKVAFRGPVDPLGGVIWFPQITHQRGMFYLLTERGLLVHVKKNPLLQLTEIKPN